MTPGAPGTGTAFFGTKMGGGDSDRRLSVTTMGAGGGSLTKNQQARSLQMVQDFVITDEDTDTVDVKSLAEMALVARTLRSAIWIACGEDEQRVADVMRAAVSSGMGEVRGETEPLSPTPPLYARSFASQGRGVREASIAEEQEDGRDDGVGGDDEEEEERGRDGEEQLQGVQEPVNDIAVERSAPVVNVEPDLPDDGRSTGGPLDDQNGTGTGGNEDEEETSAFDAFKLGDGHDLHQTYENVKSRLKEAKALQRTLVKVVNEFKAQIDVKNDVVKQINEILSSGEEGIAAAGGKDGVAHDLKNALDELAKQKSEYKTSRNELLKCKDNIADLTVQKQESLSILVKAFEKYSTL
jgi:hypothetical protein